MERAADRLQMDGSDTAERPEISIVIAAYESEAYIEDTVADILTFIAERGLSAEVILVNDGSTDATWSIISGLAAAHPEVTAINLDGNHGQHTAQFAGLHASRGRFVVTMDDDGQHPAAGIGVLYDKALEGHDFVSARFGRDDYPLYRRVGSRLAHWLSGLVFGRLDRHRLSSFRCLRRDVVDRIVEHAHPYPYITGLALLHSERRANPEVEHRDRRVGRSTYRARTLIALAVRILMYASPLLSAATITVLTAVSVVSSLISIQLITAALTPGDRTATDLGMLAASLIVAAVSVAALAIFVSAHISFRRHRTGPAYRVSDVVGAKPRPSSP